MPHNSLRDLKTELELELELRSASQSPSLPASQDAGATGPPSVSAVTGASDTQGTRPIDTFFALASCHPRPGCHLGSRPA